MQTLNHTHDPAARSWLASANGHPEFPIQNLPFAEFSHGSDKNALRGGVAIGDQIIDLAALAARPLLQGVARAHCQVAAQDTLNAFMFLGPDAWRSLRHALFALLLDTASAEQQAELRACLVPQSAARFGLPTRIGDYTDFYTSIHHARNVGRIARPGATHNEVRMGHTGMPQVGALGGTRHHPTADLGMTLSHGIGSMV